MTIDPTGLLQPQLPHVKRLIDSLYINGFAMDMSSTGTGKTYCAASVAREMTLPFVVIAPKAVLPAWARVLRQFNLIPLSLINYEKIGRGNTELMKWKKLSDPALRNMALTEIPEFQFPPNTLVILDEGHRCKAKSSSNAWMLIALAMQGYKVLVASATLATSPLEMRAIGYLAKLHKLHDFTSFCRQHGAEWVGAYGALTYNEKCVKARASMAVLNHYLFDVLKCASRLTVDDMGASFPETKIIAESYDMGENGSRIADVYDEMERELDRLDELSGHYQEHIFAILIAARRKVETLRVPLFVERIEDLYAEGKSVVIFVNFKDSVNSIFARLSTNLKETVCFIIGGQAVEERQLAIDEFQADRKRIIICNIAAGSTGIGLHDLHGNFPRATLISPTWSAVNLRQCFGRVWRQNGLTKSIQFIIYAANCIEEQICRNVQFKLTNLDTLNDGELCEATRFVN